MLTEMQSAIVEQYVEVLRDAKRAKAHYPYHVVALPFSSGKTEILLRLATSKSVFITAGERCETLIERLVRINGNTEVCPAILEHDINGPADIYALVRDHFPTEVDYVLLDDVNRSDGQATLDKLRRVMRDCGITYDVIIATVSTPMAHLGFLGRIHPRFITRV